MDDHAPLVERLRDLGRRPIDPAISRDHLSAMAGVRPRRGQAWTRLKVGGAFAAGLLLGGTGLASAGALPGPAQNVAHTTLSKVGVNVPHGTARFNDPAVCGLDPATQQPFRNHGQYVKAHKGDPAAAQSRCGKPLKAGTGADPGSPPKPAEDPADPNRPGGGNGKGNGNGRGNGDKVKPAKDKGADEAKEPAAPPAPAAPAPPTPPPTTAAATTTTVPPTTSTSSTSTTSPTSTTLPR